MLDNVVQNAMRGWLMPFFYKHRKYVINTQIFHRFALEISRGINSYFIRHSAVKTKFVQLIRFQIYSRQQPFVVVLASKIYRNTRHINLPQVYQYNLKF